MTATLSVTNPKQTLHIHQQFFARGKQETMEMSFVAALTANIFASKAQVIIDFKDIHRLPPEVKENLKRRFLGKINGVPSGSVVNHVIKLPLRTSTTLSPNDQRLSLSRTNEHDYNFPLVKKLTYVIESFEPPYLTEDERDLVNFIQETTKTYFPNAIDDDLKEHVIMLNNMDVLSSSSSGEE